jgi:erythromycin esterase
MTILESPLLRRCTQIFAEPGTKEAQLSRYLLAIAVVNSACSSHMSEPPKDAARSSLHESGVAWWAEGSVTGPGGELLPGALVAMVDEGSYRGERFSVSDHNGRFSLGIPATPAVVTATAGGYVAKAILPKAGNPLSLVLDIPSSTTHRYAGTVVDITGHLLRGVRVRLMDWGSRTYAAFYAVSDAAGRVEFLVSSDGSYDMMVDDPRYIGNEPPLTPATRERVSLIAYERDWIESKASQVDGVALRDLCVPLNSNGFRQFAGNLRSAAVVGLGESTHGTHEYSELRRQLIEALVREHWLTTIALEASWEEVAHLDDYVRRGKGTAWEAVQSLIYWPWRIEEFVTLVESIKQLNDGLPADQQIEFVGIDYAPPRVTVDFMHRSFGAAGAPALDALSRLEPLRQIARWKELPKLTPQERDGVLRALRELRQSVEMQQNASPLTLRGLAITQYITEFDIASDSDFRNPMMAHAVLDLLSRSGRRSHVAVWAHEAHLAKDVIEGAIPMGHYLHQRLADKYVAIGSMFYDGSFRTYSGAKGDLVEHVVQPPPAFFLESAMRRVSRSEACMLDVTAGMRRPDVRSWLSLPKLVRLYGANEISEAYPWAPIIIPDHYSAMFFVPRTTATTPLEYHRPDLDK